MLNPIYPLADHVCQLSRRLGFSLVSRGVRHGEYSQNFADRLHVVDMIVPIRCNNLAVGEADIRPPMSFAPPILCLPGLRLRVGRCENARRNPEIFGHCCHPFDVRHNCLPPVKKIPRDFDELLSNV